MKVMKIGNIEIKGFAALAPMAGVADRAMREICIEKGAAFCVGELTSSRGVTLGDKKSFSLLSCSEKERPIASQLFGSEPQIMAEAAVKALNFNPDFIDINMGCPAPKVAGNGGGSALMRDPALAEKIVKEVVNAVNIPVTVKMRTGWDSDNINAVELAKRCEAAGAKMLTVHGRTRMQMYAPGIDYETIKNVVKAVKIPVVANGDVRDGKSAKNMYETTGCAFVMVGRAAQGNPFVFEEINAYLKGESYTPPTLEQRFQTLMRQVELMHKYKDPRNAILEARKHTAWYMQGLNGAAALRRMCGEINSLEDISLICEKALEQNKKL
ncbi:MAG: tRNA dihydrouridine synthase DusB [Ruminococcaceae bacterium]|nr:tRNA dihydrouridine synthase DusB [Oscillospiraceae bacterium]